jgi:hypothetical protein
MWFLFFLACGSSTPENISHNNPMELATTKPVNDTKVENNKPKESNSQKAAPKVPEYIEKDVVTLSGTATYTGNKTGKINIEVLQNEEQVGAPTLLAQKSLSELGAFEIKVPKEQQNLTIMIYIDTNLDEITDNDPRGYYTFASGTKNITDVTVTILDEKELKELKEKDKPEKKKSGKKAK